VQFRFCGATVKDRSRLSLDYPDCFLARIKPKIVVVRLQVSIFVFYLFFLPLIKEAKDD